MTLDDIDTDALLEETPEEPAPVEEKESPAEPEPEQQPEPQPEPVKEEEEEPLPEKPEINLEDFKLEDVPDDYEPKTWKEVVALAEERAYKRMKADEAQEKLSQAEQEQARALEERELTKARKEIETGYDREIETLTKSKRIPEGEDGLKRQEKVWMFMNQENARRQKEGIPFYINSFEDALDKLESIEAKQEAKAREEQEAKDRKVRGSMIGGTSGAKVPTSSAAGLRRGMSMDDVLDQEGY